MIDPAAQVGKRTRVEAAYGTEARALGGPHHPSYEPLLADLAKIRAAHDDDHATERLVQHSIDTIGSRYRDADPPDNKRPADWTTNIFLNFKNAIRGNGEALAHLEINLTWVTAAAAQRARALATPIAPRKRANAPAAESEGPCVMPDTSVFGQAMQDPLVSALTQPYKPFLLKQPTSTRTGARTEHKAPTPGIDRAIKIAETAANLPLPEAVTAGFEGLRSLLELAKADEERGGAVTAGHVLKIGGAVITLVGAIVKLAAQNTELAEQAFEQLAFVGKLVGNIGGGFLALDDLSKVMRGTTLRGTPVDQNEKWQAGINLVVYSGGPVVGTALAMSTAGYKWVVNLVYPARDSYRDGALDNLLRSNPEKLKDQVRALPTDPGRVMWTIDQLLRHTFPATTGPSEGFVLSDGWDKFWRPRVGAADLAMVNASTKHKPGDEITDAARARLADSLKSAAYAFIDQQARDAHSKDR